MAVMNLRQSRTTTSSPSVSAGSSSAARSAAMDVVLRKRPSGPTSSKANVSSHILQRLQVMPVTLQPAYPGPPPPPGKFAMTLH